MSTQTAVRSPVSYPQRINNIPEADHLYVIGHGKDRHEGSIEVEANTRSQAAAIARKAGYVVRDVNMVA